MGGGRARGDWRASYGRGRHVGGRDVRHGRGRVVEVGTLSVWDVSQHEAGWGTRDGAGDRVGRRGHWAVRARWAGSGWAWEAVLGPAGTAGWMLQPAVRDWLLSLGTWPAGIWGLCA